MFLHIFSLLEPVTSSASFVLFPTGETGKINLCDSENLTEAVIAEQAGTEPIWMLWSSSRKKGRKMNTDAKLEKSMDRMSMDREKDGSEWLSQKRQSKEDTL